MKSGGGAFLVQAAYPCRDAADMEGPDRGMDIFVPLRFRSLLGILSFFSTTTVFGTPVDVTLSEIAIGSFCPTDEATRTALQAG